MLMNSWKFEILFLRVIHLIFLDRHDCGGLPGMCRLMTPGEIICISLVSWWCVYIGLVLAASTSTVLGRGAVVKCIEHISTNLLVNT